MLDHSFYQVSYLNSELHDHLHEGWKKTTAIGCIVAAASIGVFFLGQIIGNASWSIAGVGIVTFFGMLIISSYYSIHNPDSKGTMRKAIATSMISVYVVVLGLLFSDQLPDLQTETAMELMKNFSYIIMTVIGFYFGSKGVTEFLEFWKGREVNDSI